SIMMTRSEERRVGKVLRSMCLVTACEGYRLLRDLEEGRHMRPFFLASPLFLLGYLGLGVSLFPYIVPLVLAVWQPANTVESQLFALVGFAIFFSSRRRHTRLQGDWSSDVCSSDLVHHDD